VKLRAEKLFLKVMEEVEIVGPDVEGEEGW